MAELNATWLSKPSDGCAGLADEVRGILAYQRFLEQTWEQPSASAVFVAFHDLVTGSVDDVFLRAERSAQYCLKEALEEIKPVVVTSVESQSFLERSKQPPMPSFVASDAKGVPGLDPSGPACTQV